MLLQKILTSVTGFIRGAFKGFVRFGQKFGWVKVGIGALVLILAIWGLVHLLGGKGPEAVAENQSRTVELKSVAELSSNSTPLSIAGTVSSKSEASIRAEAGGRIVAVNYTLGDYVGAGAVIAQTENASQRAAVMQAQGAVDAASAGASVSQTGLAGAKSGAVTSLLSAYGAVDKAVHADVDPMFSNPEGVQVQFLVQSSDSQSKINAENLRSTLSPIFTREAAQSASLSTSADLVAELQATQKELRVVRDFLDAVIKTLNSGIATNNTSAATIATYLATANGARAAVVGSISALVSAQQSIETAEKGADTNIGSSAAVLTQAQAGLAAARASLEKTIVRAPISGTINSLSLKVGDYLSAGTVAAVVANNGALEVVAYVTENDARELSAGAVATIETKDGTVKGTVTRVAPALDPQTKKVEVRIGIVDGASKLLNGQSVTVSIARAPKASAPTTRITLPLSALKVGADSVSVFTLDETNKLVAHTVVLGTLLGDRVVIESGVTADMKIVTDARGLQPGQAVLIK
ncbi:MAG: efflux RND transporter periplasmic adaptor subunit [Patescibacteria group bacterium]